MSWRRAYNGRYSHPKLIGVRSRYGCKGLIGIELLWDFTAEHCPDGRLLGLTAQDLGIQAGFSRRSREFVDFLVEVKLLDFDEQTYSMHGWAERQPFSATERERRERNARNSRKRWGTAEPAPEALSVSLAPKGSAATRKHQLPDDFMLDDSMRRLAVEHHVDPEREFERFRNHALSNGRKLIDWPRGWANWILRAEEYGANSRNGTQKTAARLPTLDELQRRDQTPREGSS